MTLAYILESCCLLHFCRKFGPKLIISQLRMKPSSSNCLNHVRRSKSSINKRIIVRRTQRCPVATRQKVVVFTPSDRASCLHSFSLSRLHPFSQSVPPSFINAAPSPSHKLSVSPPCTTVLHPSTPKLPQSKHTKASTV